MAEVIGVRFKEVGKVYYFDPLKNKLRIGDKVIVETARGLECGEVAMTNKVIGDDELIEITPKSLRIRKKILDTPTRLKAEAAARRMKAD